MSERTDALTVLTPTHGRPTLLGRTLDSLAECELPEAYLETVVVENGPKAGAETVVQEAASSYPHLRLRYMHVDWANKSHALNEALKSVVVGLVVLFDDDVRLEKGVLVAYTEAAAGRAGGAFFGGPIASDFEERPPEWLLPLMPASVRGFTLADTAAAGHYLGANWAAYTSDIQAAGGFGLKFGPGSPTGARGQEFEMQRRLRRIGVKAVDVADALVWHYVPRARSTPGWLLRRKYQVGLSLGLQYVEEGQPSGWRPRARLVLRGLRPLFRQALGGGRTDLYAVGLEVCKRLGIYKSLSQSNRENKD